MTNFTHHFFAFGCTCEIQLNHSEFKGNEKNVRLLFQNVVREIENEAQRIELKFTRYRTDNLVARINTGHAVTLDSETYALLQYADFAYRETEGLFDITTGKLRQAWVFDGQKIRGPAQKEIDALKPFIGWSKVNLTTQEFQLPAGMEIDLGGLGKEYAVDCCAKIASNQGSALSFLLNFGGDLFAFSKSQPWRIGLQGLEPSDAPEVISLQQGGIATSGDTERFVVIDGVSYGHILNPLTCSPVEKAPRSVTVVAASCTEAGLMSTFAMLSGEKAEIAVSEYRSWIFRHVGCKRSSKPFNFP